MVATAHLRSLPDNPSALDSDPDLKLLIRENRAAERLEFSLFRRGADGEVFHDMPVGEIALRGDPDLFFRRFFEEIEKLPQQPENAPAYIAERIAAKGRELFQRFLPEALQVEVWRLRNHIKSVLIQSQEPWIPWELCQLTGVAAGEHEDGLFFCEQFAVTRWLSQWPLQARLSLHNMAVIHAEKTGLKMAAAEVELLKSKQTSERRVTQVPARWQDVRAALATGMYDGIHFTGHAGYSSDSPSDSPILLEDGLKLRPSDLSGAVSKFGQAKPLVFLNGCRTARVGFAVTSMGGWAECVVRNGAAAFVGSMWIVQDEPAYKFAECFYENLFQGVPLGEAVRKARVQAKQNGDPSWLAYTVYGHPMARITTVVPTLPPTMLPTSSDDVRASGPKPVEFMRIPAPPSVATHSQPPYSNIKVRAMLNAELRTDADFSSFFLDSFPATHVRFSQGMERVAKINLALQLHSATEIAEALLDWIEKSKGP